MVQPRAKRRGRIALLALVGACSGGEGPTGSGGENPGICIPEVATRVLDPLRGHTQNEGNVINDSGTVAGVSYALGTLRAGVVWEGNQPVRHLGVPGDVHVTGINDAGQVVGWTRIGDATRAFLWQNDAHVLLRTPAGHGSAAYAVNEEGVVVGSIQGSDSVPVMWRNGGVDTLRSGGEVVDLTPTVINDSEVVAGYRSNGLGPLDALAWSAGTVTVLSRPRRVITPSITGINNANQVVGYGSDGPLPEDLRALLWRDGRLVDELGPGAAQAVNEQGHVVINGLDPEPSVTIWSTGARTVVNLGKGTTVPRGLAINRRDQVAGVVVTGTGEARETHGFVWTVRLCPS